MIQALHPNRLVRFGGEVYVADYHLNQFGDYRGHHIGMIIRVAARTDGADDLFFELSGRARSPNGDDSFRHPDGSEGGGYWLQRIIPEEAFNDLPLTHERDLGAEEEAG